MTSLFDKEEFKRYAPLWQQRQKELRRRAAYYDGSVYKSVRQGLDALGNLGPALGTRLYRGTKALFLPLNRAVNVDAGIIPGDWKLPEDQQSRYQAAIDRLMAWSDWDVDGVLYVHYGAQYGITGLKISDLRDARRVVIKPVDPTSYLLAGATLYNPIPQIAIFVEDRLNDQGERYEYGEVITPDFIRTFSDGEPQGFDERPEEYPNALGFVPFVEQKHIENGQQLGECTYQQAIPLLNEVNELSSYLADIIKKHADPQWGVIGAEAGDMVKSSDNIWFLPPGSDAKAFVAAIDVAGILSFVQEIRDQVMGALPELAFDELKQKTQIATATLELQLMELVLKVKRTRPNYDHGLADALRLAGRAASTMNLTDIAILDDEGLMFDKERPVLPLDRFTELEIEQLELSVEQQRRIGQPGEGSGVIAMDGDAGQERERPRPLHMTGEDPSSPEVSNA
ncbi:MAG: hypothetical protein GFH27_549283n408 [Chloroflexi bacterium AL-W]|nr:hypothetical protein [Chloroflexi bacterium AL-N1]NOK64471.1 hypothetical protein [Chloroflexi bacterium AL-N10]NOK75713.1 hypothetical protein [Chloroflexi bacterium AL-N5]NOK80529.1 hypothetical protein [Chloroflexi bacterium AL-W]NOK87043.1 hypothetical protein [Chloroflexi bacterium AL-N15]